MVREEGKEGRGEGGEGSDGGEWKEGQQEEGEGRKAGGGAACPGQRHPPTPPHALIPSTRGRDQGLANQGESQWTYGPQVEQRDFREA